MFLSWIHQIDSIGHGFSLILVFLSSFRNFWVSTSCQFSYLVACPIKHYWFGFLLTLFLLNEKTFILISSSFCWTVSTFFFWDLHLHLKWFILKHFSCYFYMPDIFVFVFDVDIHKKYTLLYLFFFITLCVLGVQLLIILLWPHNQQLLRRDQLFGFLPTNWFQIL